MELLSYSIKWLFGVNKVSEFSLLLGRKSEVSGLLFDLVSLVGNETREPLQI